MNRTMETEQYVRAALRLQGYDFSEERSAEIALQFSRIAGIADSFLDLPLPLEAEQAGVFRP
ncbi:DUF4089 domain-containing protein [Lacisediminimonas profundi]|uniref:DUF4089 domain-containing protein n=1 Tax=Lacisediminimonas profundi TaxID=2603856 RepID=UPI00124B4142|nr:DUF4089 domain-containing protein [Lacisediminimonas profundi]